MENATQQAQTQEHPPADVEFAPGLSLAKLTAVARATSKASSATTDKPAETVAKDTKEAADSTEKPKDGAAAKPADSDGKKPEDKAKADADAKAKGADAKKPPGDIDDLNNEWAKVRGVERKVLALKKTVETQHQQITARETELQTALGAAKAKESEAAELIRLAKEDPARFAEKAGVPVRRLVESVIESRKAESEAEAKLTPEQRELRELKAELEALKTARANESAEAKKAREAEEEAARTRSGEEIERARVEAVAQLVRENEEAFIATLSEDLDTDYPTLHEDYSTEDVAQAAAQYRIEHFKSLGSPEDYEPLTNAEVFEELEKRAVKARDAEANKHKADHAGRRAQFLAKRGKTTAGGGQDRDTDGTGNEPGGKNAKGSEPITNAQASQRASVGSSSPIKGNREAAAEALRRAKVIPRD